MTTVKRSPHFPLASIWRVDNNIMRKDTRQSIESKIQTHGTSCFLYEWLVVTNMTDDEHKILKHQTCVRSSGIYGYSQLSLP